MLSHQNIRKGSPISVNNKIYKSKWLDENGTEIETPKAVPLDQPCPINHLEISEADANEMMIENNSKPISFRNLDQ